MARYYDLDKLKEMIEAKADTLIEGKEGFLYVAKWLDLLQPADVVPKSEVERLIALNSQLEEKFFEERGKVERLHGILLQFTDIVHKWRTKNNIDTSEISLVPIMNEEADSIIQKANQEVAREIFEAIEELAKIYTFPVVKNGVVEIVKEPFWCIEPNDLAELKKKYTEDTNEQKI